MTVGITHQHPAAKWEIAAKQAAALFNLSIALRELQGFVAEKIKSNEADIDSLALSLDDTSELVDRLNVATEVVVASTHVASDNVSDLFDMGRATSEVRMEEKEQTRVTGERVLLVENLIIALGREIEAQGDKQPQADAPVKKRPPRHRKTPLERKAREARETEFWEKFRSDFVNRWKEKGGKAAADATIKMMEKQLGRAPRTIGELAVVIFLLVSQGVWPASTAAAAIWLGNKITKYLTKGDGD